MIDTSLASLWQRAIFPAAMTIITASMVNCTTPRGSYSDANEERSLGDKWNNTDANKTAEHMVNSALKEAY